MTRAKKKTAALENMMEEMGLIKAIKMTGNEYKTKGERARTAGLGKPGVRWRTLYPPRHSIRGSNG